MVAAKGSPGASCAALALALAWPLRSERAGDPGAAERVLVIEADPAGSSAFPGYLGGELDPGCGMDAVVGAGTGDGQIGAAVAEALLALQGYPDRYLLVGFSDPAVMAAHHDTWPRLAAWLQSIARGPGRTDVLVDLGRVGTAGDPVPLLQVADVVMVVCRATLPSVLAAHHSAVHVEGLTARGLCDAPVVGLLVADGPYPPGEVEAALRMPLAGVLSWDPAAAQVFSHGRAAGRGFTRGPLLRSARQLASRTVAHLAAATSAGNGVVLDA